MNNKISVLMTAYNAEKFIFQSIESILEQTFKDYEFIIIDDYSEDKTFSVIKKFSDKRLKTFRANQRLGRTNALNYGLEKCSSNLITIQDADDLSHPYRLEETLKKFKSDSKIGLVCSDYELIDENENNLKKKIEFFKEKKILSLIKYFNLIPHSSITFKKNSLICKKSFFYDESFIYAQDYNLILKYLKYSKISVITKKLVKIRQHSENMTNNKIYKKLITFENLKLLNFSERNFKNSFKEQIMIKYFKLKNYVKLFLNFLGM